MRKQKRQRKKQFTSILAKAKRKAEKEGRELPAEMQLGKIRPPSGQFSIDEDTGDGPKRAFLDHDTGQQPPSAQAGADESGSFVDSHRDRCAPLTYVHMARHRAGFSRR